VDVLSLVVLVAIFSLFVSLVAALINALSTPTAVWDRSGQGKALTVLMLLFTGGVGSIYYWLRIHRVLRRARQSM